MSDELCVGVSLLAIKEGMIGGLARYVREVARALAAERPDSYVFFSPVRLASHWRSVLPPGARIELVDLDNTSAIRRSLIEILYLPKHARKLGCEVLFYPNTSAPAASQPTAVVALFDVMYRSQPHDTPFHKRLYLDWCCRTLRTQQIPVVTLSEFSRSDIHARTGIPVERIVAIPCGVDEVFLRSTARDAHARPLLPAGDEYLLSVGAAYPHKRLATVVGVFERVARSRPRLQLVMVGTSHGSKAEQLRLHSRIASSTYKSRIALMPSVAWESLPALYRGALALVQASQFEGFGLPVAEAMASRTPVVTSPAPAVVELLAGHGEVATGWSEEALAVSVERMFAWDQDKRNHTLSAAYSHVAAHYRWSRVAGELDRQFRNAAGGQHDSGERS